MTGDQAAPPVDRRPPGPRIGSVAWWIAQARASGREADARSAGIRGAAAGMEFNPFHPSRERRLHAAFADGRALELAAQAKGRAPRPPLHLPAADRRHRTHAVLTHPED